MIRDNEKFQTGLIGNLPVIKVPPGRKSWAAADVFDIFISKFMYKVRSLFVLTQVDLARAHCDTKVLPRISVTGRKFTLHPPPPPPAMQEPCAIEWSADLEHFSENCLWRVIYMDIE